MPDTGYTVVNTMTDCAGLYMSNRAGMKETLCLGGADVYTMETSWQSSVIRAL